MRSPKYVVSCIFDVMLLSAAATLVCAQPARAAQTLVAQVTPETVSRDVVYRGMQTNEYLLLTHPSIREQVKSFLVDILANEGITDPMIRHSAYGLLGASATGLQSGSQPQRITDPKVASMLFDACLDPDARVRGVGTKWIEWLSPELLLGQESVFADSLFFPDPQVALRGMQCLSRMKVSDVVVLGQIERIADSADARLSDTLAHHSDVAKWQASGATPDYVARSWATGLLTRERGVGWLRPRIQAMDAAAKLATAGGLLSEAVSLGPVANGSASQTRRQEMFRLSLDILEEPEVTQRVNVATFWGLHQMAMSSPFVDAEVAARLRRIVAAIEVAPERSTALRERASQLRESIDTRVAQPSPTER